VFLAYFCFFSGIGIFALPGLWTAAIFRMGQNVFRYSFDNLGRQIASNPLPAQVRRTGKLFINIITWIIM